MTYDPIIHGKNDTERIVSIEVIDDQAELFIQKENGDIEVQIVPNKLWMLAHSQLDRNFIRLKGNLHYCWGKQYTNSQAYGKDYFFYKPKDIYTVWDKKEALMLKDGYTYFKGLQPKDVSILAFDIETTGLDHNEDSKVILIANTFRKNGIITRKLFSCDDYETEGDMIQDWCQWVVDIDPSILCGHNILSYDLPYLQFCADKWSISLDIGRNSKSIEFDNRDSMFRIDGSRKQAYKRVKVYGREIIDTMFLAVTYDVGRKYESYGLKNIIKQEGLEITNRPYYEASKIKYNYQFPEEMLKIKSYAQQDGDDALALFDLMIPAYFYLAQSVPKSLQRITESATGSQINSVLVRSYLQDAHSVPKAMELNEHVEGGISFAVPGIYNNVLKIDLKSAYPSQILRFGLYDEEKDPKGHFLYLAKYFTNERFKLKELSRTTKDVTIKARDAAAKVFINSMYGACNTNGLNFNSIKLASKITYETREVLKMSIEWASGKKFEYWKELFDEKTK